MLRWPFCPYSVNLEFTRPLTARSTKELPSAYSAAGAWSWQLFSPGCVECQGSQKFSPLPAHEIFITCYGKDFFSFLEESKCCLIEGIFYQPSVLQGDQKVSVHLIITIQKVTSNVQSVLLQSPGPGGHKTHTNAICYPQFWLRYHGKWLKLCKIFLHVFCTVIMRCTEIFYHPVYDSLPWLNIKP
jgi:hypothetical protein